MRSLSARAVGWGVLALLAVQAPSWSAEVEVKGKVKVEVYANGGFNGVDGQMAGTAIADLTGHASYPNSPVETVYPPIAEYPFAVDDAGKPTFPPGDVRNNYGVRMSGFLTPPQGGTWYFYVASDDSSELWISGDENPANAVRVAWETSWSDRRYYFNVEREWPGQPAPRGDNWGTDKRDDAQVPTITADGRYKTTNVSDGINMVAGKKYYFYALMKEGGGTDDLSIWATQNKNPLATLAQDFPGYPSDNEQPVPLTGDWISAVGSDVSTIVTQPASQTVVQKRPFTFSVKVAPSINAGRLSYKWFKNGAEVLNSLGESVNSPTLSSTGLGFDPAIVAEVADNNSKWHVEITPEAGPMLKSDVVTLTVPSDNVAPKVAKTIGSDDFNSVTIVFDEVMGTGAFDAANYSIAGLTVSAAAQVDPTTVALSTSRQALDTDYTITMTAAVQDLIGNSVATPRTAGFHSFATLPGIVGYGRWNAASIDDLIDQHSNGTPPTFSSSLSQMISPVNVAENYGGRLRTVWTAPRSGDVTIWIASDDPGRGYISTDATPANKVYVANEPTWNDSAQWVAGADGNNLQRNRPGCGTVDGATPPGGCENRSDQWDGGEWATRDASGKQKITVTQGRKYYLEVIWREGGGGDNGGLTVTYAGDAVPANGSTTVSGSGIEWYGNVDDAPIITTPPAGKVFDKGENITLGVTAVGHKPLAYQWFKNKKPIAGATSATLAITDAGVDDIGDYSVTVTNDRGSATTRDVADSNARLVMKGAFVIEAEDFNEGGGKTVAAASTMPLAANLYRGKDGIPGVDFKLIGESTTDPLANGNAYRNGWSDGGTAKPYPTTATETMGNIDVTGDDGNGGTGPNNNVRPDFTLTANYKIGWGDNGEWYNYTRNFTPGSYAAVAAISSDTLNDNRVGTTLSIVTGDITSATGQTVTEVGRFTGVGTGNWSSLDLIPFEAADGSLATFNLGANTTVRWTLLQGHDLDYLLFYPVASSPSATVAVTRSATGISIAWTGSALQRASAPQGPYTDVAGAANPYATSTDGAAAYFRSRK